MKEKKPFLLTGAAFYYIIVEKSKEKRQNMIHPVKHFQTVVKHRHLVIAHCFRAGIGMQGLLHDLSKFSPTEFIPGALYFQGTRSPTEREREVYGYSFAWMHHKGRNRHHFEYWCDLNPATKRYEAARMPIRYVKEMFCDRIAASKIYQGENYTNWHPLDYYLRGNARSRMHPDTADLLESWLTMLAEKGEEETFAHLRKIPNESNYGSRPLLIQPELFAESTAKNTKSTVKK